MDGDTLSATDQGWHFGYDQRLGLGPAERADQQAIACASHHADNNEERQPLRALRRFRRSPARAGSVVPRMGRGIVAYDFWLRIGRHRTCAGLRIFVWIFREASGSP